MNSLNILSSRVISQPASNAPRRSHSSSTSSGAPQSDSIAARPFYPEDIGEDAIYDADFRDFSEHGVNESPAIASEKAGEMATSTSLHSRGELENDTLSSTNRVLSIAQRLYDAVTEALKLVVSMFTYPAFYIGRYSLVRPGRALQWASANKGNGAKEENPLRVRNTNHHRCDNADPEKARDDPDSHENERGNNLNSTSNATDSDGGTPRRSIRIKIQNDPKRSREQRQRERGNSQLPSRGAAELYPVADSLKSPMSSSVRKLTKYPQAPTPPRPLVPPRQPSFSWGSKPPRVPEKTLILDLDETLIHSLSKGGRMSSGHMVEVKLSGPLATSATPGAEPTIVSPQHPILYYVHKRPHCDVFLRKICQWYKLVIFTASVQEYADPVIDWLEQERKYFHGRYYRQHCTVRNGAYIKDLSSVEPDLSKVMILDNSPLSYIFHEDNAIPIEGWINDPTDNDLLHIIPILEALQYATDVRAFLTLRRGETVTAA